MIHTRIAGIEDLIRKGGKCIPAQPANRKVNGIFANIYKQIRIAQGKIKNIPTPLVRDIDTYYKLTHFSELDNSFISEKIKEYIKSEITHEIIYEYTLSRGQKLTVYFMIPEMVDYTEFINEYMHMILSWFEFIYPYSQNKCANTLTVYIYLTPFKKELPQAGENIGREHVNTAYTTSCIPRGSIVIYRSEEWFKVLLHESFHVLGLDFSHFSSDTMRAEMRKIFPISSEMNLYEAYTETWAEILNCCFAGAYISKTSDEFIRNVKHCLYQESIFSLFQTLKTLRYMHLDYVDLYSKNEDSHTRRLHLYKEESNVFSYYIITSILLLNYSKFIMWCDDNNLNLIKFSNKTSTGQSFIDLIKREHDTKSLIETIRCLNNIYSNMLRKDSNRPLLKTMRMSIIDLLEN